MADFVGSAYTLQRIVGKAFVGRLSSDTLDLEGPCMTGLGFFVARADATNPNLPAGALESFDPLLSNNMMEPWIWRRTWILGHAVDLSGVVYPSSSCWYGSVLDGPHIDSTVKRRINDDDRLWMVMAMGALDDRTEGNMIANWHIDLRILVTLRKNRNQSAF